MQGRNMAIAYLMIGIGLSLLVAGLCLNGLPSLPPREWPLASLLSGLSLVGVSVWLQRIGQHWVRRRQVPRASRSESTFASTLTPQLYGEYSEYVIEAARQLGEARDLTAVPALLYVLEECVNEQRPGWRDVATALANALSTIGDRRALPLLYRLDNVRGIGLIPAIRDAIAAIEPQSSLLRASGTDAMFADTLLRPAHGYRPAEDPQVLLRSTDSDSH